MHERLCMEMRMGALRMNEPNRGYSTLKRQHSASLSSSTAASIVYHGSSYWWSPTQFTIGAISLASSNGGSASALTQAHGALMVAAWGGLIPLACAVVRHMRLTLPFTKLVCGYKNWLQVLQVKNSST